MTICDDPDKIIRALEATCTLSGRTKLTDDKAHYLGASVGTFDINKSFGGKEEIYPYMGAEEYISKAISVVEEFFDLSKVANRFPQPRDYHPELDKSDFLNDTVSPYTSPTWGYCVGASSLDR